MDVVPYRNSSQRAGINGGLDEPRAGHCQQHSRRYFRQSAHGGWR